MYEIIDCLTNEHNHVLVTVAALICIVGTTLTAQLLRRMKQARGKRQRFQVFLGSLICGATIWSTHFIAMLAYEPGYPHGYEPEMTAASLVIAVAGVFAAVSVLAFTRSPVAYLAGGSLFGLTVSTMHYTGMSAYLVPGYLVWQPSYVTASLLIGVVLGAAAFHRICVL